MEFLSILIKLILSTVLAGFLGWERESGKNPAGFRTHILVSLGATVFTLVPFLYLSGGNSDAISRITAGIVTGVGFLGAGSIIRSGEHVRGLTTAASVWISAAIGMAVGFGLYALAILASLFAFIVLRLFLFFEKR